MNASPVETQKENPDAIPADIRHRLEAARDELNKEAQAEKTGATKLAATKLGEALTTSNRATVSLQLKELRNGTDFHRLSEPLRLKLDVLQTEIETTTEKGIRLTQEGAGAVKDAVDGLHPILKTGIYAGTIVAGSAVVMKAVQLIKNFFVSAGKGIGKVATGTMNVAGSALGGLWTATKIALGIGGIAAMGKVGYDAFKTKEADPSKPNA